MLIDRNRLNNFCRITNSILKYGDILSAFHEEILILSNEIAYFVVNHELYYYDFDQETQRLYFYFNDRYCNTIIRGALIINKHLKCH